tara:strand:+ start:306 stop:695 length:390 start_codon:yes stop_codon:yes gene_type:complete
MKLKKPKISSNRSFGIVFFIFFLIVSIYPILNTESIRVWSLILAIIFLILGLINSEILTPLNKLWFKLGIFLGRFIAPIVMGFIFFFVVTPTSLIMKLLQKDILRLKKNNSKTYWINKSNENNDLKNQF